MAYYHGVKTSQKETSVSTPVTAASGITLAVGTAPVHTVGGKVNEPIMAMTYAEAVAALGYSDDWGKYSLCEVIYNHFKLYTTAPVFFVNVLDPQAHKTTVAPANVPVKDKKALLPLEAIAATVVIGEYAKDEDYALFYEGENLIVEILDGGAISAAVQTLSIGYTKVNPAAITETQIIGGFDVTTKKSSGLELIDAVFPKYGIAPDILICPGWSQGATVAAIMAAKAANINGVFSAVALIDADTTTVRHYADVPEWKKAQNINAKQQILCFPKCKMGDKVFWMSTQAAALMARVDGDNDGCPAESPSNKLLQINSTVLADGSEVLLDFMQANYLNSNGIVTAINFIGGFVLWGNETACYPANTDVKDYFINISRMFAWVSNSVILTYWSKTDKNLTRRFIDSIIDSMNIWLNGLTAAERILGGRVEMREDENPETALMAGKVLFHIFLTPPSPAKEIEFLLEYDVAYVKAALAA
jgi:phage tail sheath protein FI